MFDIKRKVLNGFTFSGEVSCIDKQVLPTTMEVSANFVPVFEPSNLWGWVKLYKKMSKTKKNIPAIVTGEVRRVVAECNQGDLEHSITDITAEIAKEINRRVRKYHGMKVADIKVHQTPPFHIRGDKPTISIYGQELPIDVFLN